MFVGSVSILGTEDCIDLALVDDRDVLIAAACLDGESPGVLSVELGKWKVHDVELIGRGQFGRLADWIDTWFLIGWCIWCGEYCKAI